MQFSLRTSTLLAGLIVLLSLQAVDSLSVSKHGPESRFLTFPLRRMEQRSDIHPQVLLQMHINRSIQRLAKMTGAEPPSARSLEQRLERRMLSLDIPTGSLRKRQVMPASPPTTTNSLRLGYYGHFTGYVATIPIGTPPKNFTIQMDSASADFWVRFEGSCVTSGKSSSDCGNWQFLGSSNSSSFVSIAKNWTLSSGGEEVNGTICQDNVVIAGLKLTNHTFGVATEESSNLWTNNVLYDGVMGLANSSLSMQQNPTPVEALASAGLIAHPIVSYKLGSGNDDGEVTFGGLDPTKFDTTTLVTLENINTNGRWEVNLDENGVSVDGVVVLPGITDISTIFDTSLSIIVVSGQYATAIHARISGATSSELGFSVPCNTTASVSFKYSGQLFTIGSQDLVGPAANESYCSSNIFGDTQNPNRTQWLFGGAFLKNAYFSTDVATNNVSLAKLVTLLSPTETSPGNT